MIPGSVFKYSKQLAAFASTPTTNKYVNGGIVFVAGLGDGLLCPAYTQAMTSNFRFIQPVLSSSYNRFGTSSLIRDAYELIDLINYIKENLHDIKQIILMGFSTGCQSICTLLTHFREKLPPRFIKGVVLQGAVSDRQYFLSDLNPDHSIYHQLLAESEVHKNCISKLLSLPFMGAPINVYRTRSLLLENGDDDFFSMGSDVCVERTLKAIKECPTLFMIGGNDEGLTNGLTPWLEMIDKIMNKTSTAIKIAILKGGDHALNQCSDEVVDVLSKWINDMTWRLPSIATIKSWS